MRAFLTAFAIVLAVLAAVVGVIHFALRAHEFKIAIPAANTIDQRVFNLAAEMLRTQRAPVRLEVVTVENPNAALEALEAGKVKLAVVRSDAAMQGRAHTVLIMRREAAVLIAAKDGKLQKVTDLPNAMIGVTRDGPLDGSLLWPVLDYYGIPRDKAKNMSGAGGRGRECAAPEEGRRHHRGRRDLLQADERRGDRRRARRQRRDQFHRHRGGRRDRQAHSGARIDRGGAGRVRRAAAAAGRELQYARLFGPPGRERRRSQSDDMAPSWCASFI